MKREERENISNRGLLRKAPCERYTVKQSETRVCTENFNPDKFQEIILDLFHAGKKPIKSREKWREMGVGERTYSPWFIPVSGGGILL